MKYLFWDIDGTLLLTQRAGIDALKESMRIRYGKNDFEFSHSLAGRTDSFIIKNAITEIKGKCTASDAAGLLITYNKILPQFLATHKGSLLPNVNETLDFLSTKKDYCSALLTGNCSRAAYEKVSYYGVQKYFNYQLSTFGEISEDRKILAQAALQKLYVQNPEINSNDIYIIGDTPHDIMCANSIGVKCLIVTAGSSYTEAQLNEYKPWKIIPCLPHDPQIFLDLLEE